MHRTTIDLDDDLFRAVKRKAVDRGQPMRMLVEEALWAYLGLAGGRLVRRKPRFGVYQARVIGSLHREDIYDESLARKFR